MATLVTVEAPPDRPPTRDAILNAAVQSFAEVGYDGTTIRRVAAAAGVDPALVMHYFGSKEALFAAALAGARGARERILATLDGPPEGLAERFVRTYLSLWEDPEVSPALRGIVRSAVSNPLAGDLVRQMLESRMIAGAVEANWPAERVNLVGAQLLGVAMARYVLRTEPVASLPVEDVVALVVPGIQKLLGT